MSQPSSEDVRLADEFSRVANHVRGWEIKPPKDEFNELHALYKQATEGDCNIVEPSDKDSDEWLRWKIWLELKGLDSKEAMK